MPAQIVGITIHEGVQSLDVAGPADVFNEANSLIPRDEQYEIVLIGADLNPLRASNKTQMIADVAFEKANQAFDILLVAGGPSLPYSAPDGQLINWLRKMSQIAAIYGSICTGAFTLGHAGLLNGKKATTHWQNVHTLAAKFPEALVEPDSIFVQDGQLVTSAGITAGIDLSLALVRKRHGAQVAVAVAKRLVVLAQRQGGQSQFSPYLSTSEDPESPVARLQTYVMANIANKHSLDSLAFEVDMSPRNLTRYFLKETGMTPHEFVNLARLDAARLQLELSHLPLKTIAYSCGFGTAERMRLIFVQRLKITPAQYRASFQPRVELQ